MGLSFYCIDVTTPGEFFLLFNKAILSVEVTLCFVFSMDYTVIFGLSLRLIVR